MGFHRQVFHRRRESEEIQRSKQCHQLQHAKREAEVADAVHHESFLARITGKLLEEIKTDQQVAAQAHTFPTHEHQQEVLGQHQDQHEEHEQIQVAEKTVVTAFVRHVADGIEVNQQADAGNHEQHHGREAIHKEVHADLQRAALKPREIAFRMRGIQRIQRPQGPHDVGERHGHGSNANEIDQRLGQTLAKQAVDQKPKQREEGDEPEIHEWATVSSSRLRRSEVSPDS